jgi:membrane protein YdbS with pleckstrin-like domain
MYQENWLKLHPKAKIALIIKGFFAMLFIMLFFLVSTFWIIFSLGALVFVIILSIFFIILLSIISTWAIMFYNRYTFRISDDAVYINRGILWKRNVVIPYERIQHTSTTRGPIDLLLGLHILNIFTAGTGSVGARFGGTAAAFAAEGSIPGLMDPKPFQDAIMAKVKLLRGDGFGAGPQRTYIPPPTPAIPVSSTQTDTQQEMLNELRRIREVLEKKG